MAFVNTVPRRTMGRGRLKVAPAADFFAVDACHISYPKASGYGPWILLHYQSYKGWYNTYFVQ
jgi:hypothetical protein